MKELTNAQEFIAFLNEGDHSQLFVYFSATKEDDGQPWCPDCASGMVTTLSLPN